LGKNHNMIVMIDRSTVARVAQVARLDLTEAELDRFSKDMASVLDAFKVLGRIDTKSAKPAFQPLEIRNVTRQDVVEPSLTQADALANTGNREQGCFRGPKVI